MEFNYYSIIVGTIIGIILFFKLPRLYYPSKKIKDSNLDISIIIPARNEEKNLPNILNDLNSQTYNIKEIICVDDNSDDNTLEIIKEYGATAINVSELPLGWKGKPWACQCGAKEATGSILLFIDADVSLSNTAIESLAYKYTKKGNPISVQPYHTVEKFHEFFSLFFNLIEICNTAMSLFATKKTYGFFGPVFMISKDLFNEHEGYNIVKNNVIEDFSLGKYYNQQGINIGIYGGAKEISFRMYPDSFSSVFEAWTRNFSTGSATTKFWLLLMTIIWLGNLTILPIELAESILAGNLLAFAILLIAYLFNVIFIYRFAKAIGSYPFCVCLFYPVFLCGFHIIFLSSLFRTYVFKSTTWKGRTL